MATASQALLLATGRPHTLDTLHTAEQHFGVLLADSRRCFSQTALRPKKSGGGGGHKKKKGGAAPASEPAVEEDDDIAGAHHNVHADPANPFDFADAETAWQRIETHQEERFKELRRALGVGSGSGGGGGAGSGGVDVEAVGQTPVALKGAAAEEAGLDAAAGGNVPLNQLALVIPRAGGRVVELRMHSAGSKKAIVSAVQANTALFRGQQPQPDPGDELVLLVKMGGANDKASSSAEAAAERTRRVHDLANAWRSQLRKVTARRQKAHQTWKKEKLVQPDDLHRLDRDLLRGQEKRMAKVDAAEKALQQQLDKAVHR